jgi:cytoskeletal protein RodZ
MSEEKIPLAEILKNRREELGLTISQLARELRISEIYLTALESGAHDKLPGEVYTRAYLSSLSKKLNLSFEEVLQVYVNEFSITTVSSKNDLIDFNTHGVAIAQPKSRLPYILGAMVVIISFSIIKLTLMGRGGEGAINLDDISSQTIDTLNDMTQEEDTLNTAPLLDTLETINLIATDSVPPVIKTPKALIPQVVEPELTPQGLSKDSITKISFMASDTLEYTWFKVIAKYDKDSSRNIRPGHGAVTFSMKDTLSIEVGEINKIKFKLANNRYQFPKDLKFKVFNNRLLK